MMHSRALPQVPALVAVALLENLLMALHKDKLSVISSDGAIKSSYRVDDLPLVGTGNSTLYQERKKKTY
jgi:hypothetical protein